MMRSLYSGVSGLKIHQTKMDVIGNNIANVNTVGYKSQNITFQELLYQTTSDASEIISLALRLDLTFSSPIPRKSLAVLRKEAKNES